MYDFKYARVELIVVRRRVWIVAETGETLVGGVLGVTRALRSLARRGFREFGLGEWLAGFRALGLRLGFERRIVKAGETG